MVAVFLDHQWLAFHEGWLELFMAGLLQCDFTEIWICKKISTVETNQVNPSLVFLTVVEVCRGLAFWWEWRFLYSYERYFWVLSTLWGTALYLMKWEVCCITCKCFLVLSSHVFMLLNISKLTNPRSVMAARKLKITENLCSLNPSICSVISTSLFEWVII